MAKYLAEKDLRSALDNMQVALRASGLSLRRLCQMTVPYDIPERIHHPTLSKIFHGEPDRNLYLQQFLSLSKLMGATPEGVLLGSESAASVARAFMAFDTISRAKILRVLRTRAKRVGLPAKVLRALEKAN